MTLPRKRTALFALLAIVTLPGLFPSPGEALPLFARKYKLPCTSCHIAFPRLNAFGRQFRQNGYRMAGEAGTSPWEDSNVPISFVGNVGYDWSKTLIPAHTDITGPVPEVKTVSSKFQQNAVELHTAGTLAPHITFHVDSDFQGVGLALESGMAFVQLDDLAKSGALNLKAGIYDADVPYLAASRTLTAHEYLFPLTFDAVGLELNGAKSGWTYAAAVINSERETGKPTDTTLNNFENPYIWLMRDIKGHELAARVYIDHQDPRALDVRSSTRTQVDVTAQLNFTRVYVTPGYAYEKHDDPDPDHPKTRGTGMLEAIILLDSASRWVLTSRYELQHTPSDEALATAERDGYLATADISYYLNPNARVGFDYARTASNHDDEPRVDEVQAFVHFGY